MNGYPLALVKWPAEGKYKDLEQAIQRCFISSKHFGIGDEIEVWWGKAGRVWKAIYLGQQKKEATEQNGRKMSRNGRLIGESKWPKERNVKK